MAAAGDLGGIATALVEEVLRLMPASAASMLEMRGGHWIGIASAGGQGRPISVPLTSRDTSGGPRLIRSTIDDGTAMAKASLGYGVPSVAIVPFHLWPAGPAMLAATAKAEGDLTWNDVGTLSMLAVIAGAAAYRSSLHSSRRADALEQLGWHQETLELIARGVPLEDNLLRICEEIETRYPDAHCSVLLIEPGRAVLRHVAAPTLPATFCRDIDGLSVAVGSGACGTAAATNQPVVVEDIRQDENTTAFVELASRYGLLSVWSYPLTDSKGAVVGTFALYRDHPHRPGSEEIATVAGVGSLAALAIERSQTEAALVRSALQDPLTGLANRLSFKQLVAEALDRAHAGFGRCAVIFIDLDGFKLINDGLGHEAGDLILQEVARRLERMMGSNHAVSRFGGDEFTVLIEDADEDAVLAMADTLSVALQEPFIIEGGEFLLTASVGIARSDGSVKDPVGVIRDADAAMYAAKSSGRGKRALFDAAVRDRVIARMTTEGELRRAVRENLIEVEYQPIYDLATGEWCAVEALARWNQPAVGQVATSDFIPIAEEIGLVTRLDQQVLAIAAGQAKAWRQAGIDLPVGVNISAYDLDDPDLADEILGIIDQHGGQPEWFYLEVTESAFMRKPDLGRRLLARLRAEGLESVIDDFGTGYSSIARLAELPTSGIKIDMSFTAALSHQASAATVVSAVIQLVHAFGLVVTAEGVERLDQLEILRNLGCDRAQGYLLGRPASADDIGRLLVAPPPAGLLS